MKRLLLLQLFLQMGNIMGQCRFVDSTLIQNQFWFLYSDDDKVSIRNLDGTYTTYNRFMAASEPDTIHQVIWLKDSMIYPSDDDLDYYYDSYDASYGWHLYGLNGKPIGNRDFVHPSKFIDGLAVVEDAYTHVLDTKGNVYLDACFTDILRNPDNSFWARDTFHKFHLYSSDFNLLGIYDCENVSPIFPGGALLYKDSGFRVIDTNGAILGGLNEMLDKYHTNVIEYFKWDTDWAPMPFDEYEGLYYKTWKDLVFNEYHDLNVRNFDRFDAHFKTQFSAYLPKYMLFSTSIFFEPNDFVFLNEPNYSIHYADTFDFFVIDGDRYINIEDFDVEFTFCDSNMVAYNYVHSVDEGSVKYSEIYDHWRKSYLYTINGDVLTEVNRRNCFQAKNLDTLYQVIYQTLLHNYPELKSMSFDQLKQTISNSLDSFNFYDKYFRFYLSVDLSDLDGDFDFYHDHFFDIELNFKDIIRFIDQTSPIYSKMVSRIKN